MNLAVHHSIFAFTVRLIGVSNNMNNDVVDSLQEILKIAQDESFTSDEALDVIMAIASNVLEQYGYPEQPENMEN